MKGKRFYLLLLSLLFLIFLIFIFVKQSLYCKNKFLYDFLKGRENIIFANFETKMKIPFRLNLHTDIPISIWLGDNEFNHSFFQDLFSYKVQKNIIKNIFIYDDEDNEKRKTFYYKNENCISYYDSQINKECGETYIFEYDKFNRLATVKNREDYYGIKTDIVLCNYKYAYAFLSKTLFCFELTDNRIHKVLSFKKINDGYIVKYIPYVKSNPKNETYCIINIKLQNNNIVEINEQLFPFHSKMEEYTTTIKYSNNKIESKTTFAKNKYGEKFIRQKMDYKYTEQKLNELKISEYSDRLDKTKETIYNDFVYNNFNDLLKCHIRFENFQIEFNTNYKVFFEDKEF